jgi:hypothetical protein
VDLVEPVLPLAATTSCASIDGSSHDWTTLCAVDQITSESPVLELESLLRLLILNGTIALHLVAVEVLLRRIASVAVERDRDWVWKGTWSPAGIWTALSGGLEQRLAGLAPCPYLHQEARL